MQVQYLQHQWLLSMFVVVQVQCESTTSNAEMISHIAPLDIMFLLRSK